MFNKSISSENWFTEVKSDGLVTSFPLPLSSSTTTLESTPRRALAFDDEGATPPRRHRNVISSTGPVAGRRRCGGVQPPAPQLTCSLIAACDVTLPMSSPGHVPTSARISGCMEAEEERADLIGDLSTGHALPLEHNAKHADLKTISPDTMADVMNDVYADVIDELLIVDCRYPYEYDGGHIDGATNICTKDAVISELLTSHVPTSLFSRHNATSPRTVLIFHCEFSSERAPKLLRFLRNQDRAAHADCYPRLRYPELYLLSGGYKAFFQSHSTLCRPRAYRPMLHADHAAELRHFRLKSKTWAGDRKRRQVAPRTTAARRHSLLL